MTNVTLIGLAEKFSVKLIGDGSCNISGVSDLGNAGQTDISFYTDKRYQKALIKTQAGAVILKDCDRHLCSVPVLVTSNPSLLFAKITNLLYPDVDRQRSSGVSNTAVVDKTTIIDPSAIICENAVIEANCRIEKGVYIGPGCVIKPNCKVGKHTKLVANVTVCHSCTIGDRVIIHPNSVIGSDGFGLARDEDRWVKIPQIGSVQIGNDVEIGAGVAIDRGALNNTIIESGVKLDNQIHVAHNVVIGENTAMAAQSGVAGSTVIGKNCAIGGAVGIVGHLSIADRTRLNAFATVSQSIKYSGNYASGTPLESVEKWRRNRLHFKRLDEMSKKIRSLEKMIKKLEKEN